MKANPKEELIRYAAEIVGKDPDSGQCYNEHHKDMPRDHKCHNFKKRDWNPLSDAGAYQLELIEAELVKLGFRIKTDTDPYFEIYIYTPSKGILIKGGFEGLPIDQIRLCKLKAYCEVHRKMKELQG